MCSFVFLGWQVGSADSRHSVCILIPDIFRIMWNTIYSHNLQSTSLTLINLVFFKDYIPFFSQGLWSPWPYRFLSWQFSTGCQSTWFLFCISLFRMDNVKHERERMRQKEMGEIEMNKKNDTLLVLGGEFAM